MIRKKKADESSGEMQMNELQQEQYQKEGKFRLMTLKGTPAFVGVFLGIVYILVILGLLAAAGVLSKWNPHYTVLERPYHL
ncbi:hypothetical protein QR680_005805 [Steinernema hermaphroditum]|uniref:Uncharacterized protein n=1 Tax=Steinernema hermaphroditum TaxID=289476 RepID=A0AA39HUQ2_9BILA|nr:hypothetical protein QR680_005805 [Steinernema hermaphroditum]